jgi:hypothetical protein
MFDTKSDMGMGVRTTRTFGKNEVVALYSGELYSSLTENQRREQLYADQGIVGGHQFKFQYMEKSHWYENWFEIYIPCFSGYGNNVKHWYYDVAPSRVIHSGSICFLSFNKFRVDGTDEKYNPGRLINHNCKTSINLKPSLVECDGVPKIILLAATDIGHGKELFFNYNDKRVGVSAVFPWLKTDATPIIAGEQYVLLIAFTRIVHALYILQLFKRICLFFLTLKQDLPAVWSRKMQRQKKLNLSSVMTMVFESIMH